MLIEYRTYPHIDMADTGVRAFDFLKRRLATGVRPKLAVRRLKYLVPICWQCTDIEPAKGLYKLLEETEGDAVHLSFATGFPAADFPECSPVIWAYADTLDDAQHAADFVADAAEERFAGKLYNPDEAVKYAMQKSVTATKPIVIADAR